MNKKTMGWEIAQKNAQKKRSETWEKIVDYIEYNGDHIAKASRHAGTTPKSFYRWIRDYPEFAEMYEQARDSVVDMASENLHKALKRDDNWDATKFTLETKGAKRGFSKNQTITHEGEVVNKVEINWEEGVGDGGEDI